MYLRNCKRSIKGFTLIEILVVLVIIMILAAILFPVFERAQASAQRASCASNLKQVGLAVSLYTQDYDERLPYARLPISSPTPPDGFYNPTPYWWAWNQVTYPYYKNLALIRCPSEKLGRYRQYRNYGANIALMPLGINNPVQSDSPVPLSAITQPAATYMIMDSGFYYTSKNNVKTASEGVFLPGSEEWASGSTPYFSSDPFIKNQKKDFKSGRHFHGVNIVFADGHVKWLSSRIVFLEAKKSMGDWDLK